MDEGVLSLDVRGPRMDVRGPRLARSKNGRRGFRLARSNNGRTRSENGLTGCEIGEVLREDEDIYEV